MKIEIEISDDELREHILVAAGNALHKQYSTERNLYKRTIADCVREVIYKDKKEIIDRKIVGGRIGLRRPTTEESRRKSETNTEFGRIVIFFPHRLTAARRRERHE